LSDKEDSGDDCLQVDWFVQCDSSFCTFLINAVYSLVTFPLRLCVNEMCYSNTDNWILLCLFNPRMQRPLDLANSDIDMNKFSWKFIKF
jgi:hypothetical protein